MKKTTPLVAAIIGAVMLVLQQFIGQPKVDLKVVGFAVLIAVIGAASLILKGKGASLWGIIGTVGFSFYDIWQSGSFTWDQFFITAGFAVLALFVPTAVPELDDQKE